MDEMRPVYDVLNKRRATVIDEDFNSASTIYILKAHLPICESFGLYKDMWRETSGKVNPQLEFDTWKILDKDPFYIPQTEEELQEFGENANLYNLAKNLISAVRKRKGMATDDRLIPAGEKNKTLAKKK